MNNLPYTKGTIDSTYNGNGDAFIAQLDSSGKTLLFSTYLGGSGSDNNITAIAGSLVLHNDTVIVAGRTASTDFPTTTSAFDQTYNGGTYDLFIAKIAISNYKILGIKKICAGDSTMLTASGGLTYTWSTGATTAAIKVAPLSPTTYTLTISDGNTNTIITTAVSQYPNPTPTATVTGTSTFCSGSGFIGSNYPTGNEWFFNGVSISGANTQTYYPDQSGFYSVKVTDVNGCTGTSSLTSVTVKPLPTASVNTSNTTICEGQSVHIDVSGGVTVVWSTGETSGRITVLPASTTTYTATVTDANGCTASVTQTIVVNPLPPVPTIQQNGSLLASSSSTNNQWNLNGSPIAGATSQFYTPTVSGFYSVTVTTSSGCSSTSSIVNIVISGISEATNGTNFILFPNPNNGSFNIEYATTTTQTVRFTIFNAIGKLVLTQQFTVVSGKNNLSIQLERLSPGIYFIKVQSTENTAVQRLIIN